MLSDETVAPLLCRLVGPMPLPFCSRAVQGTLWVGPMRGAMKAVKILILVLCLLTVLALALLTARPASAQTPTPQLSVSVSTTRAYDHAGQVIAYEYYVQNVGDTVEGIVWIDSDLTPAEMVHCSQIPWGSPPRFWILPGMTVRCGVDYEVTAYDMSRNGIDSMAWWVFWGPDLQTYYGPQVGTFIPKTALRDVTFWAFRRAIWE